MCIIPFQTFTKSRSPEDGAESALAGPRFSRVPDAGRNERILGSASGGPRTVFMDASDCRADPGGLQGLRSLLDARVADIIAVKL